MSVASMAVVIQVGTGFLVVGLVSLGFAIFVIVDMARRPTWQWLQARANKTLWLVLEVLMLLLLGPVSIVVGVIYLAAVRPRLVAVERQGPGMPGTGWPPSSGGPGWPPSHPPAQNPPAWGAPAQNPPAWGAPAQNPPAQHPPAWGAPAGGPPSYPTPSDTPASPTEARPASNPLFGWYPDPSGAHELRYWDGTTWTEHVSDGDQRSIDPLPG